MKALLISKWFGDNKQLGLLRRLLGKEQLAGTKVFFCVTAACSRGSLPEWAAADIEAWKKMGMDVDVCDINGLSTDEIYVRMSNAELLYFEGGYTAWLNQKLVEVGAKEMFECLLKTRCYVGQSAGGCVASPFCMDTCTDWFVEGKTAKPALGLVPWQFIPHLESASFPVCSIEGAKNFVPGIVDKTYAAAGMSMPDILYIKDDGYALVTDTGVETDGVWVKGQKNLGEPRPNELE